MEPSKVPASKTYSGFTPPGVCGTLYEYVNSDEFSFKKYHYLVHNYENKENPPKWIENIEGFFKATNDESRLHYANKFAREALYIPDMKDSDYFRNAVMTKELTAKMDYQKSRDHEAHTLYNYILGWYFFDNSPKIKAAITKAMEARGIVNDLDGLYNEVSLNNENSLALNFGDIWPFVSLFHDIGYIFEGAISTLSIEVQIKELEKEIRKLHDYFNHRFWRDIELDFKSARELIKKLNIYVPDFSKVESLASLADYLCVLGDCEPIREELLKTTASKKCKEECFKTEYSLDIDSFVLWKMHYDCYEKDKTRDLVLCMSKIYKDLVWRGLGNTGRRMLDHGIVSGLITLMYSTFFYQIFFGMKLINDIKDEIINAGTDISEIEKIIKKMKKYSILSGHRADGLLGGIKDVSKSKSKSKVKRIIEVIQEEHSVFIDKGNFSSLKNFVLTPGEGHCVPEHFCDENGKGRKGYQVIWWWQKVLWATAAAALHNIVQEEKYWLKYNDVPVLKKYIVDHNITFDDKGRITGLLSLEDDPIAYLGVLVDIIQEWDRYSVNKDSVYSGEVPLEGTRVNICIDEDKDKKSIIRIVYDTQDRVDKVKRALEFSLKDWGSYVDVLTKEEEEVKEKK